MPAPIPDPSLNRIFRERSPDEPLPDEGELAAALGALFEDGRRAWPDLALPPEAFVRHLASRRTVGEPLAGVRAADLYLACACATHVRGAVEAFERAQMCQVGMFLARLRPSAAFVDEVRQILREKLFVGRDGVSPKIAEYTGRGALGGWLRVVALRAAIDLRRQGGDAVEEGRAERADPAAIDPEVGYIKERYRRAFNDAFRRAVAALDADQHALLRLHFVEGLTLDQMAARAGVHRATIARRIAAAREAVADEARRLLRATLGASEAELDSLAGVMRSQIDLSLGGLLEKKGVG